jgi:hypothetical protein
MKAFLSSTFVDLVDHRKTAAEAIRRLGQQVGQMEVFGARPDEPSEVCYSEIENCDLFVGIYAHRYGYVPDGADVSITEAEFNHARTNNKPVFCFVVDEDHPWPPKMIEEDPGKSKLRDFKARIGAELVRDTFTSSEDLGFKIATALGHYLSAQVKSDTPSSLTSYADFFDKIMSELTSLRRELQGHTELLQKVQHISDLVSSPESISNPGNTINDTLPSDLEGCWKDSVTGSTLYARFVDDQLVVPYCYRGNSELTGVFFDFRKRAEDVFFARFKWVHSQIQGFAYIERLGLNKATGGWWFSEDVPREALENLERFDPDLPRMNELTLSRDSETEQLPTWVDELLSIPRDQLMKRLDTNA